jgi:hypothetical protein
LNSGSLRDPVVCAPVCCKHSASRDRTSTASSAEGGAPPPHRGAPPARVAAVRTTMPITAVSMEPSLIERYSPAPSPCERKEGGARAPRNFSKFERAADGYVPSLRIATKPNRARRVASMIIDHPESAGMAVATFKITSGPGVGLSPWFVCRMGSVFG